MTDTHYEDMQMDMIDKQIKNTHTIRSSQSLDILLCSGNSKMSNAIKKFQKYTGAPKEESQLSHAAAIYKPISDLEVHESTTMNKWANKSGVQRNMFHKWLVNYDGKVWIKQLQFDRALKFRTEDHKFIINHRKDKYEDGIPGAMELFFCGLRLHRFVKPFFPNYQPSFSDNPHCTELVALRLEHHNLWKPQWNLDCCLNRMPPWMWWSYIDKYLDCEVSKPVLIKG